MKSTTLQCDRFVTDYVSSTVQYSLSVGIVGDIMAEAMCSLVDRSSSVNEASLRPWTQWSVVSPSVRPGDSTLTGCQWCCQRADVVCDLSSMCHWTASWLYEVTYHQCHQQHLIVPSVPSRSAIVKNSMLITNIMALCLWNLSYCRSKFYIAGIRIFDIFGSCDLDLDAMTFI